MPTERHQTKGCAMKVYGSKRNEQSRCKWGCCATKWCKEAGARNIMDRTRRKTARREGQRVAQVDVIDMQSNCDDES